jgi:diketogulonate reductase-like aldo/keto reductase
MRIAEMLEIVEQGAGISREEADITISIEWRLLPWCLGHGLPIMAYSPLEQGRMMLEHPVLRGWRSCRPGPACGQAPAAGGMLALR